MGKRKGKYAKSEHYHIVIASCTDARKKPLAFGITKNTIIGFFTFVIFLMGAAACFLLLTLMQSANRYAVLEAMRQDYSQQSVQIDEYTKTVQELRNSAAQAVMDAAAAQNAAVMLENAQKFAQIAQAQADAKEQAELEDETVDVYNGNIGTVHELTGEIPKKLALAAAKNNNNIKWRSSNTNVAKVSPDGKVTLLKPGKATILASSGKQKMAVCDVVCTSQFDSVHFRQGDSKWKFSESVKHRACMITSMAILLANADVAANPRTVYNTCHALSPNYKRLSEKYNVRFVNALADDSPYLRKFDGNRTFITNSSENYVAALKEALDRNPEGVCLYFTGKGSHMIVAVGYVGDDIYYTDPGRMLEKGHLVKFQGTWVYYKHRMTYRNLAYMVALDKNK